jgi:hypothetical protein
MKNFRTFALVCAAAMAAITFVRCGESESTSEPTPDPKPVVTERYKTVPYTPSESQQTRATGSGIENLVFTDYDDEHNYYFFVLGQVTTAPLAYRPAIY